MLARYFPIFALALFIDGMQAMITLSFAGMGMAIAAGGTIASTIIGLIGAVIGSVAGPAGAAAGAAVASAASSAITVTAVMAGVGVQTMGFAASSCIGIVFGAAFYTMLAFSGLFKMRHLLTMRRGPFFITKFLPIVNILPLFSIMTYMLIRRKMKAEAKAAPASRRAAGVAARVTEVTEAPVQEEEESFTAPTPAYAATEAPANENRTPNVPLQDFRYKPIAPLYATNQNQPYAQAA